jgi:hypothetical protein
MDLGKIVTFLESKMKRDAGRNSRFFNLAPGRKVSCQRRKIKIKSRGKGRRITGPDSSKRNESRKTSDCADGESMARAEMCFWQSSKTP